MVINKQVLKCNWNQIKGLLRERWGQITDDEFEATHGSIDQLIGTIQVRSGELRETIERFIEKISRPSAWVGDDVDRQGFDSALSNEGDAQDADGQPSMAISTAKELVRSHAIKTCLIATGSGFIAGVALVLLRARSRRDK